VPHRRCSGRRPPGVGAGRRLEPAVDGDVETVQFRLSRPASTEQPMSACLFERICLAETRVGLRLR
jgi:hypothetical protein